MNKVYRRPQEGSKAVPLAIRLLLVLAALVVLGGTNDTLLAKYQFVVIAAFVGMSVCLALVSPRRLDRGGEVLVLVLYLVLMLSMAGVLYSMELSMTLRLSIYFLVYFLCIFCYSEVNIYISFLNILRGCAAVLALSIIAAAVLKGRFVNMFSFWLTNDTRVMLDVGYGQFSGLVGDRAFAAMAMCMGIFAELSCILARRKMRIGNVAMIALCLVGMFLSGKRITVLMLPCALLASVMATASRTVRRLVLRIVLALVVLAVLALVLVPETGVVLTRLLDGLMDTSFNDRTQFWAVAWEMFLQKPVFGWGMGSYLQYNLQFGTGVKQYAHNMYLQLLAEFGIVGFMAIMAFFALAFIMTMQWVRQASRMQLQPGMGDEAYVEYYNALGLFSLMVQTGLLVYGLTGYPLYNLQQGFFYALSIAMIVSMRAHTGNQYEIN